MIPFQNPSIQVFSLRVDEPVTTITDFVISFIGFMAFFKTTGHGNSKAINLYRYFFLFTSISTLVAGIIGHAFAYYFGFEFRMIGWVFGIIGVTFAQFAALFHAKNSISSSVFNWLKIFFVAELFIIAFVLATYRSFGIVEIQAGIGLVLIVAGLETFHYSKTKSELSSKIMMGVGLTVLAVVSHVGKLAISEWFNHMDLGHVLMSLALYTMYTGVQKEKITNNATYDNSPATAQS